MYSRARVAVNVGWRATAVILGFLIVSGASRAQKTSTLSCDDAALTSLFAPPRPQLGRYEVCVTPDEIETVAEPGWAIEPVSPLDAFGTAGAYDRSALARLYGGRRARVARGARENGRSVESITLISPYPNAAFSRLLPGTLVIRHVIIR